MPESVSRLWDLITHSAGNLSTGELILRTALICCSLFAMVQLLSMMATHYGDHHATSKSFFLSLLLHCCFGLGWATAIDNLPRTAAAPAEPEKSKIRVVMTQDGESTQTGASRSAVNSAISPLDVDLIRQQRPEQELSKLESPATQMSPTLDLTTPPTPELSLELDVPVPVPTPQSVASRSAMSPASAAIDMEQPIRQARPETPNAAAASRQQISREVSNIDLSTRVEPQRGASERVSQMIEDGALLTLPSEISSNAANPKPVGVPEEMIRRRTSPSPVPAEMTDVGSSPASMAPSTTGDRRSRQFTRSGARNGVDIEFEPTSPAKTTPSFSKSVSEPMVASRVPIGNEISGLNPRPELARPVSSPLTSRSPTRDPETYRARRIEQRKAAAIKNGGSEESERAVEASLKWLAAVQEPAGFWSSSRHGGGAVKKDPQGQNRLDGGLYADSGITGLAVLSYLGAGYTHEQGKYDDVVMKALKWLISQQHANGYLGGKATRYDMMYCHAMAAFALAEAYGMQEDPHAFPELRDSVRNAIHLICSMQNEDGGWRYGKGGESDMSMFGWQLMAIKSAINAGIPIPEENRRGMTKFLQARALGTRGGLAGYKATDPPSPAMTAEALFCRQMFSVRPRDGASQEAVSYLQQNLPRLSVYDEYYWYYGTLAMFQHDGKPWQDWNGALRDRLVGLQRTQGPLAGSWDPNGKWAGIGGRVYSTAISTMCLEVYYRFLRIYQTVEE